jgi:hypothetical protein
MRGRVISYFAMAYFGMMPVGSLLIGTVSQYAGTQNTVLGSGIMALILVGIFWRFLSTDSTATAASIASIASIEPNGIATQTSKTTNTTTSWQQTIKA